MEHYLNHFASSVKKHWNLPMFTNFGANTITYGDVACGIEKYHILFKECGIEKGDKIALCARNSAEWGMAFMAIVTYDAVIVPLLPDFLPKSVVELSCFADSKLLIADATCYNGFKDDKEAVAIMRDKGDFLGVLDVKDMKTFVSFSEKFDAVTEAWDSMFANKFPAGVKPEMVDYSKSSDTLDDLALISFTSGTSSSPKGVMIPARAISANLEFARKEMEAEVGWTILSILPLAHMFGQAFDFIFPFSKGCHIYIFNVKPTPARLIAALAEVKPYVIIAVPLIIEKIYKTSFIVISHGIDGEISTVLIVFKSAILHYRFATIGTIRFFASSHKFYLPILTFVLIMKHGCPKVFKHIHLFMPVDTMSYINSQIYATTYAYYIDVGARTLQKIVPHHTAYGKDFYAHLVGYLSYYLVYRML